MSVLVTVFVVKKDFLIDDGWVDIFSFWFMSFVLLFFIIELVSISRKKNKYNNQNSHNFTYKISEPKYDRQNLYQPPPTQQDQKHDNSGIESELDTIEAFLVDYDKFFSQDFKEAEKQETTIISRPYHPPTEPIQQSQQDWKENKILLEGYKVSNRLDFYKYKKLDCLSESNKKAEIGKRYERYVGYYFEWFWGYKVIYNGIIKKLADEGVDLILSNKSETIFIQCKCWAEERGMFENTITRLSGSRDYYQKKNKKKIRAMLIISNDNLKENEKALDYAKILDVEYKPNFKYNSEYPMVKCKKKSMIYHLPDDPMYDYIRINKKDGDLYLQTTQEADELGFRYQQQNMSQKLRDILNQ